MQVDTHTHVVADDQDHYPLTPLEPTGGWYREVPYTGDQLVALMDEASVDRAVLVQAVGAYRHDNRYVVDAARRHGDRCVAVVCTDPSAPDAARHLRALVRGDGVRGLRWWALGGEPFVEPRAVWEELAALAVPVVVTLPAHRLEELLGVLPALPPVPVAIDHCAFVDFTSGVPDVLGALAAHPNVHFKVSTIVLDRLAACGDERDGLAALAACVGADRLLWGSDFSQTHDRPYAELVAYARRAAGRLDDDARAAFLGENALRLWPDLAS